MKFVIPMAWRDIPLGWESFHPTMWNDIVIEDGWVLVPYEWMFPLGSTLDMRNEKGETENEHLRARR